MSMATFDMDAILARSIETDIFTLVEKNFPYPNFKKIRMYAHSISDHTIGNIYHHIQVVTGELDKTIQTLREFELQMVMEHTIPIMNTVLRIKEGDLVLVETHFSHDEICKLLDYHNIHINVCVSPSKIDLKKRVLHTEASDRSKFTEVESYLASKNVGTCAMLRKFRLANTYLGINYEIYENQVRYLPVLLFMCKKIVTILIEENRHTVLFGSSLLYKLFSFLYPSYTSIHVNLAHVGTYNDTLRVNLNTDNFPDSRCFSFNATRQFDNLTYITRSTIQNLNEGAFSHEIMDKFIQCNPTCDSFDDDVCWKHICVDLCLVINTCKHYASTIKDLLNQIKMYNTVIPKENITVVSGQEDENSEDYIDGIKHVKVTYSGLHLTGAIYIHENIIEYSDKYLVMIPDTIKFGPRFFTLILDLYERMKKKQLRSLPFINPCLRPTMDMGILHASHFIHVQEYLKKIKTNDTSKDNLVMLKQQLIYDENLVLGLPATCHGPSTKVTLLDPPSQFIINSNSEIEVTVQNDIQTVYLKSIDLYKYQRNFNGPRYKLIMDL